MVLSPKQWAEAWEPIDPQKHKLALMSYARLVDSHMQKLHHQYPGVRFDNARYVVHLAEAVERGESIPAAYWRGVTEQDFAFDCHEIKPLWMAAQPTNARSRHQSDR